MLLELARVFEGSEREVESSVQMQPLKSLDGIVL
jgi:hypothetical protein